MQCPRQAFYVPIVHTASVIGHNYYLILIDSFTHTYVIIFVSVFVFNLMKVVVHIYIYIDNLYIINNFVTFVTSHIFEHRGY